MTKWHLVVTVLAVLGMVCLAQAAEEKGKETEDEKAVTIDQVPAAVKATILKEAGDNKIAKIEEVSKEGKVAFYEAEWVADGKTVEIKVAADGKLLKKEVEEKKEGNGENKDEDKDNDKD